LETTHF